MTLVDSLPSYGAPWNVRLFAITVIRTLYCLRLILCDEINDSQESVATRVRFHFELVQVAEYRHGLLNSSIWTGNEAKITVIADQHEA